MSTFTAAELLALDAGDLAELLDVAPGDEPAVRAAALGLDVAVSSHRAAVERAIGVRLNLTPDVPAAQSAGEQQPAPAGTLTDALSNPAELLAAYRGRAEPFMAGTFALYSAADGSVVAVMQHPNGEVTRSVIPQKLVKLTLGMMTGQAGMLGRLLSRG